MLRFAYLLGVCAAQLLAVVELSRHGARSPSYLYEFDEDYWDPEFPGELTGVGMRQHYLIGAELKQRLITEAGLLSAEFNESQVEVWSTDANRTLTSAYSQMVGMFPYGLGPVLTPDQPASPPFPIFNQTNIEKALGQSALPSQRQSFPIYSQSALQDFLLQGYNPATCPHMRLYQSTVLNRDEYQSKQNQLNMTLFRALSGALGVPIRSIQEAAEVSTAIECDIAAGNPLPSKLTKELYQQLRETHGYYVFMVPFADVNAVKVAFSEFFEDVLKVFADAIEGKGKAFKAYVGHEENIAGVLSGLGAVQDVNPPFASVLQFSLYDNQTVSVTYNDQDISSFCPTSPCSYDSFVQYLTTLIDPDYKQRCFNLYE